MNYQSTFKVSPHNTATGTWSFRASLLPHPIQFMYMDYYDSVAPAGTEVAFLNQQLSGADHYEKFLNFRQLAQRYRLAYMSVTVYQDGPDLANQGTIVVSQPPVEPREYYFSSSFSASPAIVTAAPRALVFTDEDYPSYQTSQSMPNAYFGRSREGAYVPLKLTETCQDWRSDRDVVTTARVSPLPEDEPVQQVVQLDSGPNPVFPFDIYPLHKLSANSHQMLSHGTSDLLNGTWAHICAENLSVQTSYSFFVRCGIEMQVSPSSSLAPQLKLSPPYDGVALTTYFAIARELKDAYPADYNDRGKIWDAISAALRAGAPAVGSLLPGAPLLMNGAAALGDYVRQSRAASRAKPSAAQVARMKEVSTVVRSQAKPRRKRAGKKKASK